FESLINDDVAVLVPVEQLDSVGTLVPEDEDVPGQGVMVQLLPHLRGKPVEATAQIDRGGRQPNAHRRGEVQHDPSPSSTASSRRKVAASKPGATRTVRPSTSTTSSALAWARVASATTCTA